MAYRSIVVILFWVCAGPLAAQSDSLYTTQPIHYFLERARDSMHTNRASSFRDIEYVFNHTNSEQHDSLFIEANLLLSQILSSKGNTAQSFENLKSISELIATDKVTSRQKFVFHELMLRAVTTLREDNEMVNELLNKLNDIIDNTEDDSLLYIYNFKLADFYYQRKENKIADSIFTTLIPYTSDNPKRELELSVVRAINFLELFGPEMADSARTILKNVEHLAISSPQEQTFLWYLGNLATTYYIQGNYEQALKMYKELLPQIKGNPVFEANTKHRIALIMWQTGNRDESLHYIREALDVAQENNFQRMERDLLLFIYERAKYNEDFKKAVQVGEQIKIIDQNIDSERIAKEIAEIQAYLELENRKRTIELLEKGREQDRLNLILTGIIVLMLIVSSVFTWRGLRKMKRFNAILSTQKRNLEDVIDTKNKIFSIIGHDLRGPIGNIYMFLDVMNNEEDLTETDRKDLRRQMMISAEKSLQLLENLLFWGRDEMKDIQPALVSANPALIVRQVIELLSFQAEIKNIEIRLHLEPEVQINTDEQMMALIIRNVIGNAIKFTEKGGKIDIYLEQDSQKIMLTFSDNGIGMDDESKQKLLTSDIFSKEGTGGERGYGLGFYLVKVFTEKLGGTFDIDSKEQKGTSFCFEFPKK